MTSSRAHSPELPKALGFRDLVLLKLVAIVNINFVPVVAGFGRVSLWLWAAAFLLFFVPEVVAVLIFAKRYPGEGGIYLWTRRMFGDAHGFLSGWSYWTNNLFYIPSQLVYIAGAAAYAGGRGTADLVNAKWFVALVVFGWLVLITVANVLGLGVGKWVQNVGAFGTFATLALVVLAGGVAWESGAALEQPFMNVPGFDMLTGFSVMCFAFVGIELASTMGDEIRHPERDLPRAAILAGVLSLLAYLLLTGALQALVPAGEIGAIQGLMQAFDRGAERIGMSWVVGPLALVMAVSVGGAASAWFAGSTRVPFMAGFDNALPPALGRVHPRWGSPHVALIATGVISALLIVVSLMGSTVAEAYQVLLKASVVIQLIPFVYLFAGLMRLEDVSSGARLTGLVGLVTCVAGMAAAFLPSPDVTNVAVFEAKLVVGIVGPTLLGFLLYWRARAAARAHEGGDR